MSELPPLARPAPHRPALAAFALLVAALVRLGAAPPPALCVVGDLRTHLAGRIPAALAEVEIAAAPYALGFGKAAIGDWGSLGDALLVGGTLYLRSTARGSADYQQVLAGARFRTSSFALLRPGRPLPLQQAVAGSTLAGQLAELERQYPRGVLFAGYLRFESLALWALARPAIDGTPVSARVADYYTEPVTTLTGTWAYVAGVTARRPLPPAQRDDPYYQRLLAPAVRPDLHIVYALALARPPADTTRAPDPATVVALGQVTRNSLIREGSLRLLPFARLGTCPLPGSDHP